MDELGVPPEIAANLTVPDTVYSLNKNSLQDLVDSGKAVFVLRGENKINLKYAMLKKGTQILWGDKILRGDKEYDPNGKDFILKAGDKILRKSGEIIDVELDKKKPFKIEIGDVVERQLMDGDYVLFNQKY
jgi:DNA-directed RNA polymerase beta' subunit